MNSTLCWKCSTAYPCDLTHCPKCGALNGNDLRAALIAACTPDMTLLDAYEITDKTESVTEFV